MPRLHDLDEVTQNRLLLQTYLEFEEKNAVPGSRHPFRSLWKILEYVGALQLSLLIAAFSIFISFVVVNLILHL